ncbi:MAG: cytochrome c-type biogenesis protein CcmH [Gemmatimonadota bacterium]|nr:cytochrome c-type biogenesis protein CcmH [Gemmatimonadota bacterium]
MIFARRAFLGGIGGALLLPGRAASQQEALPSSGGASGELRDPDAAGRSRAPVTARDNDAFVRAVEERLRCTCGCTLDIYTCRTTDFTCTYSPELHREVLALQDGGKNADEIVAVFVEKYGEKVLMAPKPEGFNIAGYVLPTLLVLMVAGIMVVLLRRRMRINAAAGRPGMPAGAAAGTIAAPPASAEELARLERELRSVEE